MDLFIFVLLTSGRVGGTHFIVRWNFLMLVLTGGIHFIVAKHLLGEQGSTWPFGVFLDGVDGVVLLAAL